MSDNYTPVFYGIIEIQKGEPKINLDDREGFSELIRALVGKEIEIRLQKRRRQRSLNQNAYFHGVVLPMIATACGYDRSEHQEVKDGLKLKFLRMARSGVGIDTYRGMADSIQEILDQVTSGDKPPSIGIREIITELADVRSLDDRGKLQLVRSTADLDTAEFTVFVEDCRRWAAETLHINIPDPDGLIDPMLPAGPPAGPQPVRSRPRSSRQPQDMAPRAIAAPEKQ